MNTPSKPHHSHVTICNLWLFATQMVLSTVGDPGDAAVLTMDENGLLEAFFPDHPDYADKAASPGFLCTVSGQSDRIRIASRLRAAAERNCVAD